MRPDSIPELITPQITPTGQPSQTRFRHRKSDFSPQRAYGGPRVHPCWQTSTVSNAVWERRAKAYALGLEVGIALTAASVRIGLARSSRLVHVLGTERGHGPTTALMPVEQLNIEQRARLASAMRVGRMVKRVAALLPWHPTCLRQSLATRWLLKRRGLASVTHLGVADVKSMDAHAWVTVDGHVVNGAVGRSFARVASFE